MKKEFTILCITLNVLISSCKPDPEPCIPPIKPINASLFEYLPDTHYPKISYKNQVGNFLVFDQMVFHNDTEFALNPCNPGAERLSLTYSGNNSVDEIIYICLGEPSKNIDVWIGPDICKNMFRLNIDSLSTYVFVDTLDLSNKLFYDVYYRTSNSSCTSDMYYNKQYGVVGFNWLGEWYVLETDSL